MSKPSLTSENNNDDASPEQDAHLQQGLNYIRKHVAQPFVRGFADPQPAILSGGVLIGSKNHAADVTNLVRLNVTAVLNCASGGISRLPVDQLEDQGIRYQFTNVRQDDYQYPILHETAKKRRRTHILEASAHLQVARQLYYEVVADKGGKILFFCVAGMNRSTCLGIATLMLFGYSLQQAIDECAQQRPFVLENKGFQQQLVELEWYLQNHGVQECLSSQRLLVYTHGALARPKVMPRRPSAMDEGTKQSVEIELLIPGLCTMDVRISKSSTIEYVKESLIAHANQHLLTHFGNGCTRVAKSWLVLAMFGYDSMYDVPLEVEAVELRVQLERIQNMFGLKVEKTPTGTYVVEWTKKTRFALVIFSVYKQVTNFLTQTVETIQIPWTFVHEERPGSPATFLENNLLSTHLRAWDFVTGQAYASDQPIVFSYSTMGLHDRRSFMKISTSANQAQQFHAPGEGNILGMGNNAIVHRVSLKPTSLASPCKGNPAENQNSQIPTVQLAFSQDEDDIEELSGQAGWDAAVKRPFTLSKMLASLESSSEAGLAKRVRFANSLNSDGRVLYFYGLGVAMSANMTNDDSFQPDEGSVKNNVEPSNMFEYKWEAILLARYEEEFSTYTMKRFMDDYTSVVETVRKHDSARADEIEKMQQGFSLISVKVLLVSLLNAFRDLTLMGVQAFDFNHLSNVLISRDHRNVRLIDIDGNSKGSIQFPSDYIDGGEPQSSSTHNLVHKPSLEQKPSLVHKPSLDVDLNSLLPTVIQQLLLGKGRNPGFVTNTKSEIWHAPPEKAKEIIRNVLLENFYSNPSASDGEKATKHVAKVAEWFYAVLKKQSPWLNWTNDIYDAMRCIDHLPIT